jgi:hypothetical protein
MIDWLMPYALYDALRDLSGALAPRDWRRVVFAALAAVYLIGLGLVLRYAFLRADLALAERARGRGAEPLAALWTGRIGQILAWVFGMLGAAFVSLEAARMLVGPGGRRTLEELAGLFW